MTQFIPASLKRRWKQFLLGVLLALFAVMSYTFIASRGTFAARRPASQAGGSAIIVGAPGHRIAGRVYVSGTPSTQAPIVIVLHGDAPFVNPSYQYAFASDVADAATGTRVVAFLRPGYADPFGAKSDGNRGFALGENYTLDVVNAVASAIQSLRSQWNASSVILVGHSGGAAIAANIAALNTGLVRQVFLVGSPCDVPAFRQHMARLQGSPFWLFPVHSLSPMQMLSQMRDATQVTAISGANDPITLPQYAHAYIAKASAQGISASLIMIPNQGHEILNEPDVIREVAKAAGGGL
jgi:alpha-beta hydrolase superfamily lysophospholipase